MSRTVRSYVTRVGVATLVAALLWLVWPIYGFYAHRGKLPLPPTGWLTLPDTAPVAVRLHDPRLADASDQAVQALGTHRRAIGAAAISAAVARDGAVIWEAAIGWADIASGTPVTPATRFRIGSTSKAITGALLARLTERGVLDLDAPISTYLQPLPNAVWADITAR